MFLAPAREEGVNSIYTAVRIRPLDCS